MKSFPNNSFFFFYFLDFIIKANIYFNKTHIINHGYHRIGKNIENQ